MFLLHFLAMTMAFIEITIVSQVGLQVNVLIIDDKTTSSTKH